MSTFICKKCNRELDIFLLVRYGSPCKLCRQEKDKAKRRAKGYPNRYVHPIWDHQNKVVFKNIAVCARHNNIADMLVHYYLNNQTQGKYKFTRLKPRRISAYDDDILGYDYKDFI